MPDTNICQVKYANGKVVSRLCIYGNKLFLEPDFPRTEGWVLSEVSSCQSCPTYPTAIDDIGREELKGIVREIVRELKDSGEI
jgi:hypothetical protein